MSDLGQLVRKLEFAPFSSREQLAVEAARELTPAQLEELAGSLDHPAQTVRLGVIEVLWRANHRDSLRRLLAHASSKDGDDRVFAIRALAQLARPEDEFLVSAVRGWLVSRDTFVEAHAAKLARTLAIPVAEPTPAAAPKPAPAPAAAPPVRDEPSGPAGDAPLEKLVATLLTATTDAERIAAVAAIERRGAQPLAAAARVTLPKANADAVAFVCRALIRQAAGVVSPERLVPLLEQARRRLAASPIACAAIDDCLVAVGGLAQSAALLSRMGELDGRQLVAIVRQLRDSPASELALRAPYLIDALAQSPAFWPVLGPLLADASSNLRESARQTLRTLVDGLLVELRDGRTHEPATVISLAWILARLCERGEPLPRQLRGALDRIAIADAARALAALCARLATEEAALVLVAMLEDPLPEARTIARETIAAWQSPWARFEGDKPRVVALYEDEQGQPLVRRGDRLVTPISGEDYILDLRGRPTRAAETEHGGCVCCAPPRMLTRRKLHGLRCPSSGEPHLREGGRVMLESEHALGRCGVCDSIRPRVRDGVRAVCLDCGAGSRSDEPLPMPAVQGPAVPSEHAHRPGDAPVLPKPPTREELELIAPHIRAAMTANVFLLARDGDGQWSGSGIIIAREGNHVAILTNRHVVETDTKRLCVIRGLAITGEQFGVTAVWRAARGLDLAIVEGRVEQADQLNVMPLGTGTGLVGSSVFAIGNPLGLAWSYTGGTLSAIRHWTTHEGQSVRILQTDAPIAPGSSGGGLFHSDGHLLGVMSFTRQGYAGDGAHFALSVDAIRDAFAREDVRWHGRALADLPR